MSKWALWCALLLGCSEAAVSFDGRPCAADGSCVSGYRCDTDTNTCFAIDRTCVPSGVEVCDGVDNDCDGTRDNDDAEGCIPFYWDLDGDGFGDETTALCVCNVNDAHEGMLDVGGDCDDDPFECGEDCNPDALEICDDVDNDCDPSTSEAAPDLPGCEDYMRDADGDGYGVTGNTECLCQPVAPYSVLTQGGDCDDVPASVTSCGAACRPGLAERCDGFDNDCNPSTTEAPLNLTGCTPFFRDEDDDGFGLESDEVCACAAPNGYAAEDGDCDDDPGICGDRCFPRALTGFVDACDDDDGDTNPDDFDAFDNNCDGIINNGAGCIAGVQPLDLSLEDEHVVALARAANGTVFIATQEPGVVAYLEADATDVAYMALPKNKGVTSLLVDNNNALWVGYQEAGCGDPPSMGPATCNCGPTRIAIASGTTTQFCTDYMSGDGNGVTTMALGKAGRVYLGTNDDYAVWNVGDGELTCDVNQNAVTATGIAPFLVGDNPAVYVATADGLYNCQSAYCDDEDCALVLNTSSASAFPNATALTVVRDTGTTNDDDSLIVGTNTDVRRYDVGVGLFRTFTTGSLAVTAVAVNDDNFVASSVSYKGTAFVGRAGAGMRWYALPNDINGTHSTIDFSTTYGLPSNTITALLYDATNARLYVGTPLGLFVMRAL